MRIAVTVQTPGRAVDVVVTVDGTATVADVATALATRDPDRTAAAAGSWTLRVRDTGAVLDPSCLATVSGLRSGTAVTLEPAPMHVSNDLGPSVATLKVVSGPDAGRQFGLSVGSVVVGRDPDAGVRLSDPLVSRRHARITVTDAIEISDLGSANGLLVDGLPATRVQFADGTAVQAGDTVLVVVPTQRLSGAAAAASTVEVVRSPRIVPPVPDLTFAAPRPPGEPSTRRFPLVAMVAPLVMGAVLYFATRNTLSLLFVALSPLIMAGTWWDQRLTARRTRRAETAEFEAGVALARDDVRAALAREQILRRAAQPSPAEVLESVERLGPLVWSRRAEHAEFLTVRLGAGSVPSCCTVSADESSARPEHRAALRELVASAALVDEVPIVADLKVCGALGIAGPREQAVATARACVAGVVGLHAPEDVMLAAFTSRRTREDWRWLTWLPHTGWAQRLPGTLLADDVGSANALLTTLADLVDARRVARGSAGSPPVPRGRPDPAGSAESSTTLPACVVLVEDGTPADRGRLTALAEEGPDVGVHVIWLARVVEALPAACRTFVRIDETGMASVGLVRDGWVVSPVVVDEITADQAHRLALALAPVVDAGATAADQAGLPSSVSFLSLAGQELGSSPTAQVERWRESGSLVDRSGEVPTRVHRVGSLRALVGRTADEPMVLDLREQGPHALVGGTTGAGKSELLQSWVLGMATAHSPDRVNFLFVDYKGGAAFEDCLGLPHSVGLVTDLSPHLVRRALTSLRAELRRREHVLSDKGAKSLVDLEEGGDVDAPPSLVIVVDEFAALAREVPEFVDGVVDVAQRGRSLGLHLILATQRPAGVIKENLRANTNLRLALRMADEDDSNDVLGSPMAAHVDPSLRGRCAARTGPGRIQAFQAAYAGGRTSDRPEPPQIDIVELGFGRGRSWPASEVASDGEAGRPKEIHRVVRTMQEAARMAAVPEPRRPWLPVLADAYDLAKLGQRSDASIVLGVVDDPERQDQRVASFRPDVEGNLAVFGAGGAGKSVLLRTLAAAATVSPRGGPVHIYGIDCAGGALAPLEVLPSVGAVIAGDDTERVLRLFTWLRTVMDERAVLFAQHQSATLTEYRERAGAPQEPRYLLLLDGFGAFRSEYETVAGRSGAYAVLQQLLVDGRGVGIHIALTADRPAAVPTSVSAAVQRTIVLRQADENSYLALGVSRDVLTPASPPGRAIDLPGRLELQLAVLGGNPNLARQARALNALARSVPAEVARRAPAVQRLPERIDSRQLPASVGGLPVLGVAGDTLAPIGFEPTGTFLIAGPTSSGRTTTVLAVATALRRWRPDATIVHVAGRPSPLVGHPVWSRSERSSDAVVATAAQVTVGIAEAPGPDAAPTVLVVEAIADFLGTPAEQPLTDLIKKLKRNGGLVVAESDSGSWGSTWPLVTEIRSGRRGIALQPEQVEGDLLFRTTFPRVQRTEFPPGRGLLAVGGRVTRVQVPLPEGLS